MQEGSTLASLRCEHRYQIEDIQAGCVSVAVSTAADEPQVHEGLLADLSLSGVRLVLNTRLLSGQQVTLRLCLPAVGIDLIREATVCWTEPRDAETWWIGCQLDDRLDGEVIDRLATSQVIDRRRDFRHAVDQPAKVRWELSEETFDVRLMNYSKGGFCMVCPQDQSFPGGRVMLLFEHGGRFVKVPARVMWQRPMPEGRALGCSFTTRDGFTKFRECVAPASVPRRRQRRGRSSSRPALSRWVRIAVVVLLAAAILDLVGLQPRVWQSLRSSFSDHVAAPLQHGVLNAWHGIRGAEDPRDSR